MKKSIQTALIFGLIIGVVCHLIFGQGFFTAIAVMLVLGIIGGRSSDNATATNTQSSNNLLQEEAAGDLEKDDSARFITPDKEDQPIRFACSEFQTLIRGKRGSDFTSLYTKLQNYTPVQIAIHDSKEWWWFRGNFYKVEFEEGRPSAELAADLEADDSKSSLSLDPDAEEVGFSPDEVAEGVFQMEGNVETGLEYADRQDALHALYTQHSRLTSLRDLLRTQDGSRDYGFERDDSAKVFTKKATFSTQVLIESDAHRPPQVLARNDMQFRLASELQRYHPVLLDKKVGRGRVWRSEIVAEWWWYDGNIYLAKREKGCQSEVLKELKENQARIHLEGKSGAWIPKYTVGNEIEGTYEEGYAPEEIVHLVMASRGEEESLDAAFDRVQAAKNILVENPRVQEPWSKDRDNLQRQWYKDDYLEDKKQNNDYMGYVEAVAGKDRWSDFKRWGRQQNKKFLSSTSSPRITGSYSVSRTPTREHIPKGVKMYVWQRDQGRCVNCGSNEKLEYDHIIPLAKGGSNTDRNIQLLCERCNRSKGSSIA